jgi:hypothetical protein
VRAGRRGAARGRAKESACNGKWKISAAPIKCGVVRLVLLLRERRAAAARACVRVGRGAERVRCPWRAAFGAELARRGGGALNLPLKLLATSSASPPPAPRQKIKIQLLPPSTTCVSPPQAQLLHARLSAARTPGAGVRSAYPHQPASSAADSVCVHATTPSAAHAGARGLCRLWPGPTWRTGACVRQRRRAGAPPNAHGKKQHTRNRICVMLTHTHTSRQLRPLSA